MGQADPKPESALEQEPAPGRARGLLVPLAIFLVTAAAYVASIPRVWFMHADGVCCMAVGRSLARGEGYTYNYAPFAKYPPAFPVMLAAVYGTLGQDVWAMQAMVALCGAAAVAAAYALVRARSGAGPALAVAALTATCPWFWAYSSVYILSALPYAFFSVLALWFLERQIRSEKAAPAGWLLAGIVVAVAIWQHMSGVALIPAVAAGIVLARGQRRGLRQRLVAAALAVVVPLGATGWWLARNWNPGVEGSYKGMILAPIISRVDPLMKLRLRAKEWATTPLGLPYDEVSLPTALALLGLLVVPGLARGLRRERTPTDFYLPVMFAVSYFHGGIGGYERYVVPIVPVLLYYGYLSVKVLGSCAVRLLGPRRLAAAPWLPRAGLALALLAVLLPALYSRIRCRYGASAFSSRAIEDAAEEDSEWQEAMAFLDQVAPKDATLHTGDGGARAIIHLLTDRRVSRSPFFREGRQVLRDIARGDADFVLPKRGWKSRNLQHVLDQHPGCFELLYKSKNLRLYRVHKPRLKEILAAPAPRGSRAERDD